MKRVAVITGATRGIGLAVAESLAAAGYDLVLLGRNRQRLAAVGTTLGARTIAADLADPAQMGAAIANLDLPRVDVLVHSAGILHTGALEHTTAAEFTEGFAVNVTAVAELTRLLVPGLVAARGRVVMINSGSGKSGSANSPIYSATKFALNGLAECLRLDLGPRGVQVSTVAPGRTDTDMQRQLRASEDGDYVPENYLTPGEVAAAVTHVITQGGDVDYLSIRPPQFRAATRPVNP